MYISTLKSDQNTKCIKTTEKLSGQTKANQELKVIVPSYSNRALLRLTTFPDWFFRRGVMCSNASQITRSKIKVYEKDIASTGLSGIPRSFPNLETINEKLAGNFAHIKVYTDSKAKIANRILGSSAYTYGGKVALNDNSLSTQIHEAIHLVQQGYAVAKSPIGGGANEADIENEARTYTDSLLSRGDNLQSFRTEDSLSDAERSAGEATGASDVASESMHMEEVDIGYSGRTTHPKGIQSTILRCWVETATPTTGSVEYDVPDIYQALEEYIAYSETESGVPTEITEPPPELSTRIAHFAWAPRHTLCQAFEEQYNCPERYSPEEIYISRCGPSNYAALLFHPQDNVPFSFIGMITPPYWYAHEEISHRRMTAAQRDTKDRALGNLETLERRVRDIKGEGPAPGTWNDLIARVGTAYERAFLTHRDAVADMQEVRELEADVLFLVLTMATAGTLAWMSNRTQNATAARATERLRELSARRLRHLEIAASGQGSEYQRALAHFVADEISRNISGLERRSRLVQDLYNSIEDVVQAGASELIDLFPYAIVDTPNLSTGPTEYQNSLHQRLEATWTTITSELNYYRRWLRFQPNEFWDEFNTSEQALIHDQWLNEGIPHPPDPMPETDQIKILLEGDIWAQWIPMLYREATPGAGGRGYVTSGGVQVILPRGEVLRRFTSQELRISTANWGILGGFQAGMSGFLTELQARNFAEILQWAARRRTQMRQPDRILALG